MSAHANHIMVDVDFLSKTLLEAAHEGPDDYHREALTVEIVREIFVHLHLGTTHA